VRDRQTHLSDEELLLAADGELSDERVRHLAGCEVCRARNRELDNAAALARTQIRGDQVLPSHDVARERLRASLADVPQQPAEQHLWLRPWHAAAAGALALICVVAILTRAHGALEVPSARLTPGAARVVDREALCNSALPKNQVVPAALRERVFQAYGIANADPRKYEVDYLITPALGGADDIRNLWPQPYVSTAWNAHVKDELEDRLRDLVCGGRLDLAEAQRAISTDWIAAYKKYVQSAAVTERRP
jgi:hypothetical protein